MVTVALVVSLALVCFTVGFYVYLFLVKPNQEDTLDADRLFNACVVATRRGNVSAGDVLQEELCGPISGVRMARNDVNDHTEPTNNGENQQKGFIDGVDVWMMCVEQATWMAFCTASEAEQAYDRLGSVYKLKVSRPKVVTVQERMHCAWCGERLGGFHHKLGFEYTVAAWEACGIIVEGLRSNGTTRIDDWLYDWLDMTWCADPGPERPSGVELAERAFAEFDL